MVKWEGYSRNMQCHLAALDKAPDGSDLGLKLLPYANGDPAPVFFTNDEFDVEHDPLDEANEAEEDEEEAEPDAPPPDVIEAHGQEWMKRMPHYVKVDARGKPNDKEARAQPRRPQARHHRRPLPLPAARLVDRRVPALYQPQAARRYPR